MKPGDVLTAAIWMDGRETADQRAQFEKDVAEAIRTNQAHGTILGPVTWLEKLPGEDRVPPVPGHIAGPNVRLLVAECRVIGLVANTNTASFVYDLEKDDLERLRRITRRERAKVYPNEPRLTDRQCDTLIHDLGLEIVQEQLRAMKPSDLH